MNYYKLTNFIYKNSLIVNTENFEKYFSEPERMNVFELITSPGFITFMLLLWIPVILLVLFILLINHIEHESKMKNRRRKIKNRMNKRV